MLTILKSYAERYLPLWAFLISFALSPWRLAPWHIINSDGVFYLHLAYMVNTAGFAAAFSHFDWPFFPIMIASFHNLTQLSYATSAYLLEGLFMGSSALFFVKIIEILNGNKTTQWLGLLVFLSFETIINYRSDIFRDPRYWAFYLSSLYFLLRFIQTPSTKIGLFWFFSGFIAALFRIEGIAVLILTPFLVIFLKNFSVKEKILAYVKLNLPLFFLIPCVCIILTFYWLHNHAILGIVLHKLYILFSDHWDYVPLWDKFEYVASKFHNFVLTKYAKDGSAEIILFIGFTGYFLCKITWTVGLLNLALIISCWIKKLVPYKSNQKLVLCWLLLITLLIPYNFLFQQQFVSTRYLISAVITLLIFSPFALTYCFSHFSAPILSLFFRTNPEVEQKHSSDIFTLRTFFILYLICAIGDFLFLGFQLYYKRISSPNIHANIWIKNNQADLPNLCSTDSWPVFAAIGEKVSPTRVDSSLAILTNPASHCQFFVFMNTPDRTNRLYKLVESPDWQLYKTFNSQKKDRDVYIFKHK